MNKIKTSLLLTCAVLLWSISSNAQAPKYSNEFLQIGVGARSLGMSNSVVASVNDVHAGYWNPAGITGVQSDVQIGLMHAEYFAGIAKYDYGAFTKKIDSLSTFGFSLIRFGVDDIPNTTELIDAQGNVDYDRITSFSAVDYAFIFSYGRKLPIPNLHVGGNFKIIHRKVGEFAKSWGFGLDAGAKYRVDNWLFGAVMRDVTSTFNAWSYSLTQEMEDAFVLTGNEIPENSLELTLPRMLLAGGRSFKFGEKFSLLAEVDLDMTFDGKRNTLLRTNALSIDPHMGLEAGYNDLIFVRAGLGNFQQILGVDESNVLTVQPNIGLGIKIKGFTLDYALTDIGDASAALYSNIFSVRFDLNPS